MDFTKYNIKYEWGTFDYRVNSEVNNDGLYGVIVRLEWRYKGSIVVPRSESTEDNPQYKVICSEVYGLADLPEANPLSYVEFETLVADKELFRNTIIGWLESIYDAREVNIWKDSIYNQLQSKINPTIILDSI